MLNIYVNPALFHPLDAKEFTAGAARLQETYKTSSDKTSTAVIAPFEPAKSLANSVYGSPSSNEGIASPVNPDGSGEYDDPDGVSGKDGAAPRQTGEEDDGNDETSHATVIAEGGSHHYWSALRTSSSVLPQGAITRSPSLEPIRSLIESMRPKYGAVLNAAPKMANGLPSFGWLPQKIDNENDLRDVLARCWTRSRMRGACGKEWEALAERLWLEAVPQGFAAALTLTCLPDPETAYYVVFLTIFKHDPILSFSQAKPRRRWQP